MSGFLVIIGSIVVYNVVVFEREIAWKHARMYQKQKSKAEELKRKIKQMRKNNN